MIPPGDGDDGLLRTSRLEPADRPSHRTDPLATSQPRLDVEEPGLLLTPAPTKGSARVAVGGRREQRANR